MIQLQLDSLISLTAAAGFFSGRNFFLPLSLYHSSPGQST
ncbi:hypothetical protein HMPREF1546_02914 [Oscillibacter sp. KLE 1745]|nr:hypothetical protein HMPREF1546_02914 [Oscillibacter sp. KLE 1745]